MKRLFQKFSIAMADAALLEIGIRAAGPIAKEIRRTLEDRFVEAAFAEAAIPYTIPGEHHREQDTAHPDECQYGDNDACLA